MRHKKNFKNRLALIISGSAFFISMSAYAIVKLDATMHRPRELPLGEIGAAQNIPTEPLVYLVPNTVEPTSDDQQNWRDAETTLVKYFENINAGNYAAAVSLRTPEYLVGTPAAYALQLENSMKNDISGKLKITAIERIANESKATTKYFRFRKDAVWSFDGSTHSEIRKAAVVLRDGKWTIDFFEVERKF